MHSTAVGPSGRPRPSTVAGPLTSHGRQPVEIWPGSPTRSAPPTTARGVNFALFCEVAERVELCLIDDDGAETRVDLPEVDGVRLARLPARRPARAALRLPGARPLRPRERATAATRASCCSTPTPRRSRARSTATSRCSPTTSRTPTNAQQRDDSLGHTMLSVVINPFFDWGHDRPPRHEYHETVIYEAHVKGLTDDPPGRARGDPRHVCRASRTRRSSSTSPRSASPRSS